MANILSDTKKQQVIALGQLGWTLRRIEAATGVRRETAGAYLKAAGLAVRPPGRWGHPPANPAKEVSTDPGPLSPGLPDRPPWRHRAGRRPRQSPRGRAHAGHLRSRAQSALPRRAGALRRRRAALSRR